MPRNSYLHAYHDYASEFALAATLSGTLSAKAAATSDYHINPLSRISHLIGSHAS